MLPIQIIIFTVLCGAADQLNFITNKWKLVDSSTPNHKDQKLIKVYLTAMLDQKMRRVFDKNFIDIATASLKSTRNNRIVFTEEAYEKFHGVLKNHGYEIPQALRMLSDQMHRSKRCVYIDCERSKETVTSLKGILKKSKSKTERSLRKSKSRKVHFGASSYRVIPNREMLAREQIEEKEELKRQQNHIENNTTKTQRRSTNPIIRQNPVQLIPSSRVQYRSYILSSRMQYSPYSSYNKIQYSPPTTMFYRSQQSIRSYPNRHSLLGKPSLLSQVLYPYSNQHRTVYN